MSDNYTPKTKPTKRPLVATTPITTAVQTGGQSLVQPMGAAGGIVRQGTSSFGTSVSTASSTAVRKSDVHGGAKGQALRGTHRAPDITQRFQTVSVTGAQTGSTYAGQIGFPTLGPIPSQQATTTAQGTLNPVGYRSPPTALSGALAASSTMGFSQSAVFAPTTAFGNPNVPAAYGHNASTMPRITRVKPVARNKSGTIAQPFATPFYGPSASPTIGVTPEASTFGRGTGAPSHMRVTGRAKLTRNLSVYSVG